MAIQFSHRSDTSNILPKPYANAVVAARSGLVHALRDAVETGDAPSATKLYRAVAGPSAAERLQHREKNRDTMEQLRRWLAQEP